MFCAQRLANNSKIAKRCQFKDMAKKIYARARLVKSSRWYIDFSTYDPATGKETRQRKDFNLNDIEDLTVREAVAVRLVADIETFVSAAPAKPSAGHSNGPTLKEAIELAVAIKQKLPRRSSRAKYRTVAKPLLAWAKKMHYEWLPVAEFTRKHARDYWDHLTTSKTFRGKTLNNYLDAIKGIWNVLDDREMVTDNPWERIKPAREEEKLRRTFTAEERRVVATHAMETDYWLFRGILLQFYCYIRPVELTRLRFKDFDFAAGTVTVREADAKQYRRVVKTIPRSILHYFIDGRFEKYPTNLFMLGRGGEPGTIAVEEMRPYKRHLKMLTRLKAAGKLKDIQGLTWYSWKDTGISLHARKTGPVATKDQAGHRSLAMTSIYYHAAETNPEYQILENDLLE